MCWGVGGGGAQMKVLDANKKICIKQTFWRKQCSLWMSPLAGVWLQAVLLQASVGVACA